MNPTQVEDPSDDETPDEARKREHAEAEVQRKKEAAAYEQQRTEDAADAETRRQVARRSRNNR